MKQKIILYAVTYSKDTIEMEQSPAIKRKGTYRLDHALKVTNGRNVIPFNHPLVAESPQAAVGLFKRAMITRLNHLRQNKPDDPAIQLYEEILTKLQER